MTQNTELTPPLPQSFLQRIDAYPEAVQAQLMLPTSEAVVSQHMWVLHGRSQPTPEELQKVLERDKLLDGLLTRLMRAKPFYQRIAAGLTAFETGQEKAANTFITEFLAPMSEPDSPYLYKIDEILASKQMREANLEMLGRIRRMAALHARLVEHEGTLEELIISEMGRNAAGDSSELLSLLIQTVRRPQGMLPGVHSIETAQMIGFIRAELARAGLRDLPGNRIGTLSCLQRDCGIDLATDAVLRPAQPLKVVLKGTPTKSAKAHWQKLRDMGLVQEIESASTRSDTPTGTAQVDLPATVRPVPLLLALLRHAGEAIGPLSLGLAAGGEQGSWTSEIKGCPYTPDCAPVGVFVPAGQAQNRDCLLEIVPDRGDVTQTATASQVTPEDAFAVVLVQDDVPEAQLEGYLNLDRCLLVRGWETLRQDWAAAPRVLTQKPLVVIGSASPKDPAYIVSMVQLYWGQAGKYPVSLLGLSYDGATQQFALSTTNAPALQSMAVADMSVLPLSMALTIGTSAGGNVSEDGLLWPDTPVVIRCLPALVTPRELKLCQRRLSGQTPAMTEAVFLKNSSSETLLRGLSLVEDWPLTGMIAAAQDRADILATALRKFRGNATAAQAEAVIAAHKEAGTDDKLALLDEMNAFAVTVSLRSDLLAEVTIEALHDYLALVRRMPSLDQIGRNLWLQTGLITGRNFRNILPLFEVFGYALPGDMMQSALAFTIAQETSNRGQHRLAECVRRYGSPEVMIQFLMMLAQRGSDLLQDSSFLLRFRKVLASEQLGPLQQAIGSAVTKRIAATQDPKDAFKDALVAGDRDRLLNLLRDRTEMRKIDLFKWMDSLRSHSNELRAAALPAAEVASPQLSGVYANVLLATSFADIETLKRLDARGFLEDQSDLSIVAKKTIGLDAPLDEFLARRFEGTGIAPLRMRGSTTAEVFANAAEATAGGAASEGGPKVSVIISAFNPDLELFRMSLDSVLNQTHRNIEIFVVDDASEPDSSAALAELCAEHPQVIYRRMAQNSGPYMGRNLAIAESTGSYIAIQDADDWSHPSRFAEQLAAFEAEPILQLVTFPHVRVDRYGEVQMEAGFTILGDGPMTSMFRKSAFETVGSFAQVRSRGDVEMRERIISYFGGHTLTELTLPMMLCLADSKTLSQQTKSDKFEYLQLFRTSISSRHDLSALRRQGLPLETAHKVAVPFALRPPMPMPAEDQDQ